MKKLLQVDFDYPEAASADPDAMFELAQSINHEPGMIWKIWTENRADNLGGGIYLFADESSAQAYLIMHTARLKKLGVEEVRGIIFDVNVPLTDINHGPIHEE
ncbi:monooxygenase [Neptunomonas sp. XY-337]|uniref:monooxygenase n=1 Tax=Neptunomonas sp. XY-337 TaxID=2561897 RepID=UPI0010AA4A28|nr:monooxygenase [Neptunomonas sp. XY-337]